MCTEKTTAKNFAEQSHAKKLHDICKHKWSESSLWLCRCGCTEFVEDGVKWRNFAILVKILQVTVMTRNFHNNSKEDFVPYWLDVAVTRVHVILIPTSFLSGLVRH